VAYYDGRLLDHCPVDGFPLGCFSRYPWPGSVSGPEPCMRFSHGLPTSFTTGFRSFPPGPEGSGCDDGSVRSIKPR
jgi:hypothetical protein